MSSARALANHKLYLAKILVDAWSEALDRQEIAANTLAQAFQAPACNHLADAYGWFLLAVTGVESLPSVPPRSWQALPAIAEGMAVPGELREFQKLEADGWLCDLLADHSTLAPTVRQRANNLAMATSSSSDPAQLRQWAQQLEALFDRMSDSLDEY